MFKLRDRTMRDTLFLMGVLAVLMIGGLSANAWQSGASPAGIARAALTAALVWLPVAMLGIGARLLVRRITPPRS